MADISRELAKFRSAAIGEDVRGSMISAFIKMNEEASHAEAWATGGSGGTPSASNNAQAYATQANARGTAWAEGVQPDGSALPDDDPAKGNSAKDWAEAAAESAASLELDDELESATKAAQAKAVGDALAEKVDAVPGKGLSENDFTDADKAALDNIAVTDNTLSVEGKAADAAAVGAALENIEIDLDDTLTQPDMAADAKAVGDRIDALEDATNTIMTDSNVSTAWESGAITTAKGQNSSSAYPARIRTKTYISADAVRISIKSGYQYGLYAYSSSDDAYIGMWDGTAFQKENTIYLTTDMYLDRGNEYVYRIVLVKNPIAATTTDDYDNIAIYLSATDDTLTKYGFAADAGAAGNRIRNLETRATALEEDIGNIVKTEITGPAGWTYYGVGTIGASGNIATGSTSYKIYYFVASEDFDIWTDDDLFVSSLNDRVAYLALYSGSTFSSETYVTDSRVTQRRNSSNTVTGDTMPKANSKKHVTAGQYVVFSCNSLDNGFRFLANGDSMAVTSLDAGIALRQTQIEQVQAAEVRPIVNKTSTLVNMYIPTANKKYFLHYTLTKVDNPTINAYGWRLVNTYLRNLNKSTVKWIVTNTEWEMAIKMNGRADFIGMGSHGDEIQDLFRLYIDGEEIGEDDEFTDRPWNVIQLICGMTMYDPADPTVVVGYHTRIDTINAARRTITIENKVKFADTLPPERNSSGDIIDEHPTRVTMKKSYLFMCPIMRTYGEKQITDTFIDNEDYVLTDCSTTTFDPSDANKGVGANKHLSTEYKFWGADYDLHGYARILRRVAPESVTQTNTISNSESYNKIYYSVCAEGEKISGGDVWLMETEFFLDSGYDGHPVDASASD